MVVVGVDTGQANFPNSNIKTKNLNLIRFGFGFGIGTVFSLVALLTPTRVNCFGGGVGLCFTRTRGINKGRGRGLTSGCGSVFFTTQMKEASPLPSTTGISTSTRRRRMIDIGANLVDPMFTKGVYNEKKRHEPDIDVVLDRALAAGVERIIVTGGSLRESKEALELARTRPGMLYSTCGVHPTRCNEFVNVEEHLENLLGLIRSSEGTVVAVGEFGLDYDRLHFCEREQQLLGFEAQFELCRKAKLPAFLHHRNCEPDFIELVRKYAGSAGLVKGGVVHSFDGSFEEAEALLELGLFIGINGCSLKTPENLEVVKQLPIERLLLETDSPWCEIRPSHAGSGFVTSSSKRWPSVKREKYLCDPETVVKSRQEPCHLCHVVDVVAAVREDDPDELCEKVFANTCNLFFPPTAT